MSRRWLIIPPHDILVASTLAHTAQGLKIAGPRTSNGFAFEQALYAALLSAHEWRYATPPDQYNLGLPIRTRTGTRYEHDGMVADDTTLYVIEAKYLRSPITREMVGIFVQKLLDTLLGSYTEIGHLSLKPVIVSGNTNVDRAAWCHAAAFGILLIVPDHPSPHELLALLQRQRTLQTPAQRLADECALLASRLWRSFTTILRKPEHNPQMFELAFEDIYDADVTAHLLRQVHECTQTAVDLRLLTAVQSSHM